MLVPESTKLPVPVLVRPKPTPDTTPDKVSCVPATVAMLLAVMVTAPDKLLLPVDADKVPPLSVIASAPTVTPCKSRVAPLATVVPAAVVPKPAALVIAKVPAETVVPPVNVLAPESVQVPVPTLVSVPEVVPIIDAKLLPVLVPPSVNPKVLPVMVPALLITILPLEATIDESLPKVMRPI